MERNMSLNVNDQSTAVPAGYNSETARNIAEQIGFMFANESVIRTAVKEAAKRLKAEEDFDTTKHVIINPDGTEKDSINDIVPAAFDYIMNLVNMNEPVYMYGPTGSGKSETAKMIANALGLDFYMMNSVTDEYKLTGFMDANGVYHSSSFRDAFENGGLFLLDELDASSPDVLIALNMAIANGWFMFPDGRRTAHEKFRVIATGNTSGSGADESYTGRNRLDAATLNRFAMVPVGYDDRIDRSCAGGDMELVDFIHAYRKAADKAEVNSPASYRDIRRIHAAMRITDDKDYILNTCLIRGLDPDELHQIIRVIKRSDDNTWIHALIDIDRKNGFKPERNQNKKLNAVNQNQYNGYVQVDDYGYPR